MSGDLLQRARILRDRRRFEDAIATLREHLALQPESFDAFYELAVTRLLGAMDCRQGLLDIERALAIFPDSAAAHSVRSALLHALGRFQDALIAAVTAKRFDPELSFAWFCEGNALLCLGSLPSAESAARKALELEPDHPPSQNLLSAALRLQQRYEEAQQVTERYLERNPENAWIFANAGWTALSQGQRDKAEDFFREALRLRPELELARLGLRDAFKSRSFIYRFLLRPLVFFQRKSQLMDWLGGVALLVAVGSPLVILKTQHPWAVLAFIGSFLLVLSPWLANGAGHLLLAMDRQARHSLNRGEKLDGLLVVGLLLGGMVVLVVGAFVRSAGLVSIGGSMMGAAVPGSFVFANPSAKGRMVFGLISLAVVTCGTVELLLGPGHPGGTVAVIAAMFAVLVTLRISQRPSLFRKKPR